MSRYNGMPINFAFADAAKGEIAKLRQLWNQKVADPADVIAIGWGTTILSSGRSSEGVVVSFYGKSERSHIEHGIELISGMEVVFFITRPDYDRFRSQTLDFSLDQGFHLRS